MDTNHVYMSLHTASIESTVVNKTRFFPSQFQIPRFYQLMPHLDYIAAYSTALRTATEEDESSGYLGVPCPSKMNQRSSTPNWLKF